jgi:glycosyltransferase involved in cell wall biosynthesis
LPLKKRLLALTRYDRLGSSSRVRFYQYSPFLEKRGMEIVYLPLLGDEYVRRLYGGQRINLGPIASGYLRRLRCLFRSGSFDLLWVEKELFPWLPALAERILSLLRIPFVVDYDDAIFHRYDAHLSSLVRLVLGHKIDAVMQSANLVIAGNDYLAARALDSGTRRVEILPSVVDMNRYALRDVHALANIRSGRPFTIGWIGSPVTAPYLSLVREPLEKICRQGDVRVVLIGAGAVDPLPGVPKDTFEWREEQEPELLMALDVGIMPLPDNPFERGKCGYKLVQYMAAGLPVIASPVGANVKIVDHGRTGLLVSTTQEWLEGLKQFKDDPEKGVLFGLAGRRRAEEFYSLDITAPKIFDLLMAVAG